MKTSVGPFEKVPGIRRILTMAALTTAAISLANSAAHAQSYTLTTIASFDGAGNGASPGAGLVIDSQGDMYGSTSSGGANNKGTLFKIAAGTDTLNTVVTFNGVNGYGSAYQMALANGSVYGNSGNQAVFQYNTSTGTSTLIGLGYLGNTSPAYSTSGVVADAQGNIYGTTGNGGSFGWGAVYKIPAGSNSVSLTASFDPLQAHIGGRFPSGNLAIDSRGVIYGVCAYIASGPTVFSYSGGLHDWEGSIGSVYPNSLLPDNTGGVYATIASGGANGKGAIVRLTSSQSTYSVLASFSGSNGSSPNSLTWDSSGNIWGTTSSGGANNDGSIFMFSPSTNAMTTYDFFNGTNGANPSGRLVFDVYGNAYGTTSNGGASGFGSVFKLSRITGAAAPEPSSLVLLLVSGGGLAFSAPLRRRRWTRLNLPFRGRA